MAIKTDAVNECTSGSGVTIDDVLIKDGSIEVDNVIENTAGSGVTVDGVLIKDGRVDGRDVSDDGATLDLIASGATDPTGGQGILFIEQSSAADTPDSGKRIVYADDGGGLNEKDDAGHIHGLGWAGGNMAQMAIEPTPALWQHKNGSTGSRYGAIRIEIGRGTLSSGAASVTFQQAFTTVLEVFLQDKTGANAMYPSSLATTGFTANGTGSDTFAWLAIGVD